jgi:hypothetical protein
MIEGEMGRSLGGVGDRIHGPCVGADGKDQQEIAEIDGLRHALNADGEITAGGRWLGFHGSFMP